MAGAVGSASSLREVLERLAGVSFDAVQSDPRWTPLFMEFWVHAAREDYARDIIAGSLRQCRELFAAMLSIGQSGGLIRSDLDVEAAATLLVGVLDAVALQWIVDPDEVDIDRLREPAADLIHRFIAVEGADAVPESQVRYLERAVTDLLEQHAKSPEGGRDES